MPELRRETQLERLAPVIFQWIKLFGYDQPFRVSELWDGGGQSFSLISGLRVPDETSVLRCQELVQRGMLTAEADGRFKSTRAFTQANVNAAMKERATDPREAFDTSGKERDQKFELLLSLKQAAREFDLAVGDCTKNGLPVSVLFVDIDNFKTLNTKYNEAIVDQTLLPDFMRLVAASSEFRAHACRHGGDEFVLVLPNCSTEEAAVFAERLRERVEGRSFEVQGAVERLTVSIGVASWPAHGKDFQGVLQVANEAKKLAKASRNTVKTAGKA